MKGQDNKRSFVPPKQPIKPPTQKLPDAGYVPPKAPVRPEKPTTPKK